MRHRVRTCSNLSSLIVLILIIGLRCHAQDTLLQKPIASLTDKQTLSFAELQKYVNENQYGYRYKKNKALGYYKALEDLINDRLKIVDFFTLKLQDDKELLQKSQRVVSEELVNRYFNSQFIRKYINEDSMRQAYKEMGKEVLYQHIMLLKPQYPTRTTNDSLKSIVHQLEKKILRGNDFSSLAARYSQDEESSSQGGFMPPVDWKQSLSNPLNTMVFHMSMNEVRTIENKKRIYIAKVVKITKTDVPPYATVKDEIRKTLEKRYLDVSTKEFDRFKANLINETTVRWDRKAVNQLVQWSNIPNFYRNMYADTLQYAISHGRNFTILRHSKGKVDLKEYLRLLNNVLLLGNNFTVRDEEVKNFILEAIRTDIIVNKAYALNLQKDVFTPETTNPFIQKEILWLYNLHEVEQKIPPGSEIVLKKFYETQKDSLFYQLAKVNIFAVVDSNKKTIEDMKRKLDQQTPFKNLAPEILVKTFIRKRDGTLDTFLEDEPPYLGEAAFRLKLNEYAGPIEYADSNKRTQYAVIQCVGIREAKQLSYSEVEKTIADQFVTFSRNTINKETIDRLRKKYAPTVYMDVVKQNLSSTGITP